MFRTYDAPASGATAVDSDDASRGLLESLGVIEEGVVRKHRFVDGAYRDLIQYGLLRRGWRDRDRPRRADPSDPSECDTSTVRRDRAEVL